MDASVHAESASSGMLDDRDHLARMYTGHAESARRHEGLRVAATWTVMGMNGILLAYAYHHPQMSDFGTWAAAVLVCALSVFGGLMNEMHDEGFIHHLKAMQDTKAKLMAASSADRRSNAAPWQDTESGKGLFLSTAYVSFYQIWRFGFLVTFLLGLGVLFMGGASS